MNGLGDCARAARRRGLRHSRPLLLAAALALSAVVGGAAEQDADIVLFCHLAIGEFGFDAIDLCVKENMAARTEVGRYAQQAPEIAARCARDWEPDWVMLKRCIEGDIAAAAALQVAAPEHAQQIRRCRDEVGEQGDAKVKECVEQALGSALSNGR